MRKVFYLLIIILLPIISYADIIKYVGIGTTRAALRSEDGKSEWGRYLGLGLEYSKPSSILFAVEVNYATKRVTLENKSWPSSWDHPFTYATIGDIPVDCSYFEMAFKIEYQITFNSPAFSLKLFAGPMTSMQYKHIGDLKLKKEVYIDPNESENYKFDYFRIETEGTSNSMINSIMGIILSYKKFGVEVRYTQSHTNSNYNLGLSINDKIDCTYILLRYSF